jgi:hypothetical protein
VHLVGASLGCLPSALGVPVGPPVSWEVAAVATCQSRRLASPRAWGVAMVAATLVA